MAGTYAASLWGTASADENSTSEMVRCNEGRTVFGRTVKFRRKRLFGVSKTVSRTADWGLVDGSADLQDRLVVAGRELLRTRQLVREGHPGSGIKAWRIHYNVVHPHSSLDFLSLEQFRLAGERGCGKAGRSALQLRKPILPPRFFPKPSY